MAGRTDQVGRVKFHVVTTTNAAGWEETGRRMAGSFIERWPACASLTVYAEDFEPDVPGIEVRRLPAWMAEFKAAHKSVASRNGIRAGGQYSYTHDAVKFAHKVAALTDFGEPLTDGVMIWLDADTFTHSDVTEDWLNGLFPASAYIAWLDRARSHPECGFVMFRCDHPYHARFMDRFRALYTSGDLFRLPETHDSYVLQHLVVSKVASRKIPPPASLSGEARRTSHPAVNGPLGARIDHLKGPRKQEGRSRQRDIVFERNEPYWRAP
jgi:hypothetical protein